MEVCVLLLHGQLNNSFSETGKSESSFAAIMNLCVICRFIGSIRYYGCKMHTLSALPCRHSCLWCLIKSNDMRIPLSSRGDSARRTVQGMVADNERFVKAGGDIWMAREYNNCIAKPFFDIPISQVLLLHHRSNTCITYFRYQH